MLFPSAKKLLVALAITLGSVSATLPELDTPVGTAVLDTPRADCIRLTEAEKKEVGAVWASQKINIVEPFEIETLVNLGNRNNNGADGIAFILQNNGLDELGSLGGGQGFVNVQNSLVVEIDTWENSAASEIGDFVQMWHVDAAAVENELSGKSALGYNIEDGDEHRFKITWDGAVYEVTLDCNILLSVTLGDLTQYVGGATEVYYGISGATGGSRNEQYVCNVEYPYPPCTSGAGGDPHFRTWTGQKYDFHGVCDLVLLHNPTFQNGLGLDIHIRTKGIEQFYSYISNLALRIGEDTLEVIPSGKENHYWVNQVKGSEVNEDMVLPFTLSGFPVTFRSLTHLSREFVVDIGDGQEIVIETWDKFLRVDIRGAKTTEFVESAGLLGQLGKKEVLGRDNRVVSDWNEFGQEWQVLPTEPKLFHNLDGPQSPEKCQIPSQEEMRRHLKDSKISPEEAQAACAHAQDEKEFCVFDVLVTSNKAVAASYN